MPYPKTKREGVDFRAWASAPDSLPEFIAALRHGGTFIGFARQKGFSCSALAHWISSDPARETAYAAVKVPRGRPTKLDAAGKAVIGQDFAHGGLTGAARWLGVDRTTIYNWREAVAKDGA